MVTHVESWGRTPSSLHADVIDLQWRTDLPDLSSIGRSVLPFGNGRSYGDSCLNDDGVLLRTRSMNHLIAIDAERRIVRCESGVTFAELLDVLVPRGLFVAVTPGTKLLTVGGAIANDVHGKNHHDAGTFGCHLIAFELVRSDGNRMVCTRHEHEEMFRATIGGLGLTGLITWAEFHVIDIPSPFIAQENFRFTNVDEYLGTSAKHDGRFPYAVSWIDCSTSGRKLGRGIYMGGSFARIDAATPVAEPVVRSRSIPFDFPSWVLNARSVRVFNTLFYHKQWRRHSAFRVRYNPFFYPLDAIDHWNRMYGRTGFFQYQCVVPHSTASDALHEVLRLCAVSGKASFLAVLKNFGPRTSPGLLSFPMEGVTLSMDFRNEGSATLKLMDSFDRVVREAGGRLYAAKDARMSGDFFRESYPEWQRFSASVDPAFSSSFWRRVSH